MTVISECHGNYVHYVMFIMSITWLAGNFDPQGLLAICALATVNFQVHPSRKLA